MALQVSTKHLAISKANAQTVAIVAVAVFITIFALVASRSVWSQVRYQSRVVNTKEKAVQQLKKNFAAYNTLSSAYKGFDGASLNIIGGNSQGGGDNDGTNSKIILDALPASYDFPALASSIEKIINKQGLTVTSVTGTDDQLNQQANISSPTPKTVPMPFSFTIGSADYGSVSKLVDKLQTSIRPIQVDSMVLSGGANNMTLTVNAHTYYQPAKSVTITTKVVK